MSDKEKPRNSLTGSGRVLIRVADKGEVEKRAGRPLTPPAAAKPPPAEDEKEKK